MTSFKKLLQIRSVRRVLITFVQGATGGALAVGAAAQQNTSLLASIAWWKIVLVSGTTAGIGALVHSLIPGANNVTAAPAADPNLATPDSLAPVA